MAKSLAGVQSLRIADDSRGKQAARVYMGTRVCVQRGAHTAWNCIVPAWYATGYPANLDPVRAMRDAGFSMTALAVLGARTIQGQSCTGYGLGAALQRIHYRGQGAIWFSSSTGRPVEVTSVGCLVPSRKAPRW